MGRMESELGKIGVVPPMESTKVVYIAGYGRSGSTILDAVLGNQDSIMGTGELTWLFRLAHQGNTCTCGQPLEHCDVWSDVIKVALVAAGNLSLDEGAEVTLGTETFRSRRESRGTYHQLWGAVFRTLHARSGRSWIVDSSKSTRQTYFRMELLHEIPQLELYVIHLVRDPRGVMWSMRRGSNRRLEAGGDAHIRGGSVRTLVSWMVANHNVEQFRRRYPRANYLRVRYEDLVADPECVIAEVGQFIGCEMSGLVDKLQAGDTLSAGHGVSGNRTRRGGPLTLRVDDEWKARLPHFDRLLARFARPWLRSYDYPAK